MKNSGFKPKYGVGTRFGTKSHWWAITKVYKDDPLDPYEAMFMGCPGEWCGKTREDTVTENGILLLVPFEDEVDKEFEALWV